MDWYRKMELETKGMIKLVETYTGDSLIANISEVLNSALENKNIGEIEYCLNEFQIWYTKNIDKIMANDYVFNKQSHIDAKEKLDNNINELHYYTINGNNAIESEHIKMGNTKVFISHSSSDKAFGDIFVKLLRKIGLSRQQIIYTSDDAYGIPQGEDIFGYLKKQITSNARIIYMLSDNYYSSVACLNEMGAAWITGNEHTILFVPGFSPDNEKYNEGALNPRVIGFNMTNKSRLIELKNILISEFQLNRDDHDWEDAISEYLKEIVKDDTPKEVPNLLELYKSRKRDE